MAQKTIVELVDDLDGSPIPKDRGGTVSFAVDGKDYEIDLRTKNAKELRAALEPFVAAARVVGRRMPGSAKRATTKRAAGTKTTQASTKTIRAWARTNGYPVKNRARIPRDIIAAYEAAEAAGRRNRAAP